MIASVAGEHNYIFSDETVSTNFRLDCDSVPFLFIYV
jgi:hypothetical protein